MAKIKLDWFKLDCQLDSKMELIEAEYGLKGFAIIVKLLQKIYGGEGYYCEWNDDIALVFAQRCGVGASAVSEIVLRAIARGIFDRGLYERYGILTSHGIQSRYYDAVGRRKSASIKPEYLLLCNTPNQDNADISSENVNISDKNADILYTEKKRKEKKRIDKKRQTDADLSRVELSASERAELIRLSDRLSVERYINKISEWQQKTGKITAKPYIIIKTWIREDTAPSKPAKEHSYDIDEWADFAMSFEPGTEAAQ